MAAVDITPTTDLAPLTGVRVRVVVHAPDTGGGAYAYTYYGVFDSLAHQPQAARGMFTEEAHGDCRGGRTGFHLGYGRSSVTVLADGRVAR